MHIIRGGKHLRFALMRVKFSQGFSTSFVCWLASLQVSHALKSFYRFRLVASLHCPAVCYFWCATSDLLLMHAPHCQLTAWALPELGCCSRGGCVGTQPLCWLTMAAVLTISAQLQHCQAPH